MGYSPIELPDPGPGVPVDTRLLAAALLEYLPAGAVLTRGAEFAQYGRDASRDYATPELVVLAGSTQQVQHVLHVAQHFGTPVYPRGLGSGLSGGAVPVRGGIVLDVSPMNRLLDIDRVNRSARVEAGLTAGALNAALAGHGLWYPPWPSSRDISSLGGNFATNAGGLTTTKYCATRNWVLGCTAVLPGGGLLHTGCRAAKDVAGLDLTQLLCGSEGMLAVAVELELRLRPLPAYTAAAIASFPDDEHALHAAMAVLGGPATPRIFEYIDAATTRCVVEMLGVEATSALGMAAQAGAVLCVETDGFTESEAVTELAAIIKTFERFDALYVGAASDHAAAQRLWRVRQEVSPACFQRGTYKLADDIAVPRSALIDFDRGLKAIAARHGLQWLNYGHIGDADFHPTLMFDGPDDPRLPGGHCALREACELAVALRGSITGEHGVGSLKADYLPLQLGPGELALMRGIKAVFDPRGIMNPGKWL